MGDLLAFGIVIDAVTEVKLQATIFSFWHGLLDNFTVFLAIV
jgi:hypothetical protein